MWEDEANERLFEEEEYISPLIELLYRNKMLLALPKGIPTYQSATGNCTLLDNMWRSNTPEDPILHCNVVSAIQPPLADHMPIITIISMPFSRATAACSLDFRQANWIKVNKDLAQRLESGSTPSRIASKDEFNTKVDELVHICYDTEEIYI